MSKPTIMTGDLSMLPKAVSLAISSQYGHHRFPWFEDLLVYVNNYFNNIFGSDYQTLLLTCTLEGSKEVLDFDNLKVVDLSNILGADEEKFNDKSVDVYVIAPERILMSIPGTAIVVIKKDAIIKLKDNLEKLENKPYLLDLVKAYNVWEKKQTTPYSPSISSVVGLVAAIKFIESHGGLEKHIKRHIGWAKFVRDYLNLNNFKIIDNSSNSFTICEVPETIKADKLVEYLANNNLYISLVDQKTINIGHLGYICKEDLQAFVDLFDKFLNIKTDVSFENVKELVFDCSEKFENIILNNSAERLLTPGPTYFNPEVFDVMDKYTYYNSKKFKEDFLDLSNKLSVWFKAHNQTLILSAPSTGFMEAAISNLTRKNDLGLIISHGKFGDRWLEICQAKNRENVLLRVEDEQWGKAFSPEDIDNFLKKQNKKIDFICFQQNETSTGVAYHQEQIKQITLIAHKHNPDIMVIMDFVSGSFAHDIDFDSSGVDAAIIGSQKGLGISSGIAFMLLSDRAITRLKDVKNSVNYNYLNLSKLLSGISDNKFISIPNIFHIYSALKSLDLIDKMGGRDKFINHHIKLAEKTRSHIKDLNLQILGDKKYLSNSVTILLFDDKHDASKIKKALKEQYKIVVAGAQSDYWKSKFLRIGHLGYVKEKDIDDLFQALKKIL